MNFVGIRLVIVYLLLFFFHSKAQVHSLPKAYQKAGLENQWLLVEQGKGAAAFQQLHQLPASPAREILLSRIYLHQGAYHLALKTLSDIDVISLYPSQKELIEECLLLRSDLRYQLLDFDLYNLEVERVGAYWRTTCPSDSLRYAWYNSLKSKFYSALNKQDSIQKYSGQAMRIFWRNRSKGLSFLPTWQFYSNYVSCTRNGGGFKTDSTYAQQDAYADTCRQLLKQWWPIENIERLRIEQALVIVYFDRSAWRTLVVNNYQKTALFYFDLFEQESKRILSLIEKLAGKHHPICAQANYLMGLNYSYNNEFDKADVSMSAATFSNFSCGIEAAPFCVNLNRYLAIFRYWNMIKELSSTNTIDIDFRKKQFQNVLIAEHAYRLQYLYTAYLRHQPEDDVYSIAPYSEIRRLYIELNRMTGEKHYLELAWEYTQKLKYTDLARQKFKKANIGFNRSILKETSKRVDLMRCMNDTLLLIANEFKPFKQFNTQRIQANLIALNTNSFKELSQLPMDDPIVGNQLNRISAFSIQAIQHKMAAKNAAWVDIGHFQFHDHIQSYTWFILPDTFWCNRIIWNTKVSPMVSLSDTLLFPGSNWQKAAAHYYSTTFQFADKLISERGIQRLMISEDPNYDILPFELLFRGSNFENPDYLIRHYAISYQLAAEPNVVIHQSSSPSKMLVLAPKLNDTLVDLKYARNYANSLSKQFASDIIDDTLSTSEFLTRIPNYSILQLYSHGTGSEGIYLSDGILKSSEVRKLQLNTDLVSLTTCESSKGRIFRNEGTFGMVEALSYAGVKRQMASLWKIDERSSVLIMDAFYTELKKGVAVDEALRRAKLQYLEKAHPQEKLPVFWAGIILYGNPDSFLLPVENDWEEYSVWFLLFVFLLISFAGIRRLMLRKTAV